MKYTSELLAEGFKYYNFELGRRGRNFHRYWEEGIGKFVSYSYSAEEESITMLV